MNRSRPDLPDGPTVLPSRWVPLATFLALLAATVLVYSPALTGGLLWDDDAHVTPPELRSSVGLARMVFEPGATQQYYPVLYSLFWLEDRLWGDATLGYHLANVLLHSLVAWLFGRFLIRLSVPGAWLAAWIFALHPVAVESVAWISEQKNTLSAVFFLLAATFYLRFDESRRRRDYVLATALFLGALGSKSATATLPAAILVVLWWKRGRLAPRRDLYPLLPWFVLAGAMAATTVRIERRLIAAAGEDWGLGLVDRILLAGRATWFYLGKLVWPAELVFIYPRWQIDSTAAWQYLFPLAAAALTVALWFLRHRSRAPIAAWMLYVGMLAPTLGFFNVYPFRYSFVADHFQYVPALSMIALAAAALATLSRPVPPRAALALGAVLPALLGVKAWHEAFEYRDAETHYRALLAENPACFMAYNNLGLLLVDSNRIPGAIELFEAGLRHKPDSAELHQNLAGALSRAGREPEAILHFEAALRLRPSLAEAENSLCDLLRTIGKTTEAIFHCERALLLQPSFAEAENNLGAVLTDAGRAAEAIPHFENALAIRPGFAEAESNFGVALAKLGRSSEALARYQSALRIAPDSAAAESHLGSLLLSLGRTGEAIHHLKRALDLKPGYPEAENGLGAALATLGKFDEARAHFEAALAARPAYASAEQNLGKLLADLGRLSEALPHLEAAARLQPANPDVLSSLAMALSRANRHSEAILRFEEALAFAPGDPDMQYNLGVALARSGRVKEARAHLEETLKLQPDHARARVLLARLAGRAG